MDQNDGTLPIVPLASDSDVKRAHFTALVKILGKAFFEEDYSKLHNVSYHISTILGQDEALVDSMIDNCLVSMWLWSGFHLGFDVIKFLSQFNNIYYTINDWNALRCLAHISALVKMQQREIARYMIWTCVNNIPMGPILKPVTLICTPRFQMFWNLGINMKLYLLLYCYVYGCYLGLSVAPKCALIFNTFGLRDKFEDVKLMLDAQLLHGCFGLCCKFIHRYVAKQTLIDCDETKWNCDEEQNKNCHHDAHCDVVYFNDMKTNFVSTQLNFTQYLVTYPVARLTNMRKGFLKAKQLPLDVMPHLSEHYGVRKHFLKKNIQRELEMSAKRFVRLCTHLILPKFAAIMVQIYKTVKCSDRLVKSIKGGKGPAPFSSSPGVLALLRIFRGPHLDVAEAIRQSDNIMNTFASICNTLKEFSTYVSNLDVDSSRVTLLLDKIHSHEGDVEKLINNFVASHMKYKISDCVRRLLPTSKRLTKGTWESTFTNILVRAAEMQTVKMENKAKSDKCYYNYCIGNHETKACKTKTEKQAVKIKIVQKSCISTQTECLMLVDKETQVDDRHLVIGEKIKALMEENGAVLKSKDNDIRVLKSKLAAEEKKFAKYKNTAIVPLQTELGTSKILVGELMDENQKQKVQISKLKKIANSSNVKTAPTKYYDRDIHLKAIAQLREEKQLLDAMVKTSQNMITKLRQELNVAKATTVAMKENNTTNCKHYQNVMKETRSVRAALVKSSVDVANAKSELEKRTRLTKSLQYKIGEILQEFYEKSSEIEVLMVMLHNHANCYCKMENNSIQCLYGMSKESTTNIQKLMEEWSNLEDSNFANICEVYAFKCKEPINMFEKLIRTMVLFADERSQQLNTLLKFTCDSSSSTANNASSTYPDPVGLNRSRNAVVGSNSMDNPAMSGLAVDWNETHSDSSQVSSENGEDSFKIRSIFFE